MSMLTREQVERECEWLVEEHCQSAARKWDAHDASQRQRIAELEARVNQLQNSYDADMKQWVDRATELEAEVARLREELNDL